MKFRRWGSSGVSQYCKIVCVWREGSRAGANQVPRRWPASVSDKQHTFVSGFFLHDSVRRQVVLFEGTGTVDVQTGVRVGRRGSVVCCRVVACGLPCSARVHSAVCVWVVAPFCGALWWSPCLSSVPSRCCGSELDRSVTKVCRQRFRAKERTRYVSSRVQRLENVIKTLSERCRRPLCRRPCLVRLMREARSLA